MKELWSLLLSAQNNVSGVPLQFLDAEEEETRKKRCLFVKICKSFPYSLFHCLIVNFYDDCW